MSRVKPARVEFDKELLGVFVGVAIITAILGYFLILRPINAGRAVQREINECQGKTGMKCDYWCHRGDRTDCLAIPRKAEPNSTDFEKIRGV